MSYECKVTRHRHGRGYRFDVTDHEGGGVCCGSIFGGAVTFDKGSAPTKAVARHLRAIAEGAPFDAPMSDEPAPVVEPAPEEPLTCRQCRRPRRSPHPRANTWRLSSRTWRTVPACNSPQ